ncbi:MAG: transglutaminase-like domain-containing protein [Lachnospiraceae bacterium]|nr:transglutaminase-like domain-containing protein [Lachnospiraceae bacterium]
MRDDYSDLEKVLALYEYFCTEYTYDYEIYEEMSDRYIEELSAYRFLTTDHGVCSECAPAFSYLLLQAGVDATTAGGICPRNGEGHAWSYVTIGGKNYHLDPTYGMESGVCLSYFMMTDEQREHEDGYKKSETCVGCHYKGEQNGDLYDADDDYFAPLWDGYLTSFDPDKNLIYYTDSDGNDAELDYSSFENNTGEKSK